jgi:hypothetical protein
VKQEGRTRRGSRDDPHRVDVDLNAPLDRCAEVAVRSGCKLKFNGDLRRRKGILIFGYRLQTEAEQRTEDEPVFASAAAAKEWARRMDEERRATGAEFDRLMREAEAALERRRTGHLDRRTKLEKVEAMAQRGTEHERIAARAALARLRNRQASQEKNAEMNDATLEKGTRSQTSMYG